MMICMYVLCLFFDEKEWYRSSTLPWLLRDNLKHYLFCVMPEEVGVHCLLPNVKWNRLLTIEYWYPVTATDTVSSIEYTSSSSNSLSCVMITMRKIVNNSKTGLSLTKELLSYSIYTIMSVAHYWFIDCHYTCNVSLTVCRDFYTQKCPPHYFWMEFNFMANERSW